MEDDDEMWMTKEELQDLVKEMVDKNSMDSPRLWSRYHLLQCLLRRRQKISDQIVELYQSSVECERLVRMLYSKLGWEYKDTDSEEEQSENGSRSPVSQESVSLSVEAECLRRKLVVVLTRLPESEISALLPPQSSSPSSSPRASPSPAQSPHLRGDSGDDFSDPEWFGVESERSNDSDSDFSTSKSMPKKKRRKDRTTGQVNGSNAKTSAAQGNETTKSNAKEINKIVDLSVGFQAASVFSNLLANKVTKVVPQMPHQEITVNMKVVAKRYKEWERGTVVSIVEKGDGRRKYKVVFASKGKIQVSGHHIAADTAPKAEEVCVGARVVVQSDGGFRCGIVGETPVRRNCNRFLVMRNDRTPIYVEPNLLRCICIPLKDVWDDIADADHRKFMWFYLKAWPYQPLTSYKVGQVIDVERDGVQKPCKVVMLDGSLIQVLFEDDDYKEWIYRGSTRLADMAKLKNRMDEN